MKKSPVILALALIVTIALPVAVHGKSASPTFVNIPLIRPDGGSEPELSIGTDGTTVFVSLSWTQFATNAWKASFGQTPVFQGQIDASLAPGVGGGEDADVDLGSTGTLHATTLLAFFNPQTKITQLGVSAITCPNADFSNNFAHCTSQIIDLTLDGLANKREGLTMVLCHFGNPWFEDVAELIYKHPNVYADISGLITGSKGYAEKYVEWLAKKISEAIYFVGGAEKIIFGTDYPVTKHSEALDLVRRLDVEEGDKEKILWSNAERVFRL